MRSPLSHFACISDTSLAWLQLAWEMLEVARSIYLKMGDAKALALAGTRILINAFTPCLALMSCSQTCLTIGLIPYMLHAPE